MSVFDITVLKKELALLAGGMPAAMPASKPKPVKESKPVKEAKPSKPRNAPKFDAWNAFVFETQKDMARQAGIIFESYPDRAAFIKAASAAACGRVAAMKEASRRREEATGQEAYVKKRARDAAAYIEEHPEMEVGEKLTYRQRMLNRLREQTSCDELPLVALPKAPVALPKAPVALPEPVKPLTPPLASSKVTYPQFKRVTIQDVSYYIDERQGNVAFYIDEDDQIGERAGIYDKETGEIDTLN
jgi:hypothetical protein